ncbi:MAG: glycosyltransferase family 39 protein, partial [Amphiplicatus sp.]
MTGAAPGAAVAALFAIAVVCFWSGLGPHDGIAYVNAALAWSENGPVLGETHWALRHLFVLPMAAGFRFFGASEFTAILPNILYAAGLVAITYIYARRCLGAGAGFAAAAFVATSAFFVGLALEVYIFGPEIFFGALAAWLFIEGL